MTVSTVSIAVAGLGVVAVMEGGGGIRGVGRGAVRGVGGKGRISGSRIRGGDLHGGGVDRAGRDRLPKRNKTKKMKIV